MDFSNLPDLLFGFRGRINRGRYWSAVVIYILFMIAVTALAFVIGFVGFFLVILVLYIPLIISGIAVGLKRLHDRDKSGWWLLLFYLVPAILSGAAGNMMGGFILSLASLAISIWAIVELGFLPGTRGPNKYGPDPLG